MTSPDAVPRPDEAPTGRPPGPPPATTLAVATLLIAAVSFGAYANALPGDFVWDDRQLIVTSPYSRDLAEIPTIFFTNFWDLGEVHDHLRSFYRPLIILSYMLDRALWGLEPVGFHVTNVYFHIVNGLLLFLWLRSLLGEDRVPLAAALLFAVHPAHVESVTWISGRTDVICATLVLGSLLSYRSARSRGPRSRGEGIARGRYLLALVLFAASLLAKEMALTTPVLLIFLELLEPGARPGRTTWRPWAVTTARRTLPFFAVVALYLGLRIRVLGALSTNNLDLSLAGLAASILHVLGRYARILFLPVRLDSHWPDQPVEGLTDPRLLLAVLVVGALATALGWAWRRSPRVLLGLGWGAITIVPVLNIGSFGDVILAERFLYLPSLGACLLLALWVDRASRATPRPAVAATAILVVLLALLGARTVDRNRVWRSNISLFEAAARTSTESGYVLTNLGLAYFEAERLEDAHRTLSRSLELSPGSALTWSNLGTTLEALGRPEDAVVAHELALQLDPDDYKGHFNLGNALKATGRRREAVAQYRQALAVDPDQGEVHTNLGVALIELGDLGGAEGSLRRALALDPDLEKAHYNLGGVLLATGRRAEAERSFRATLALDPDHALAQAYLGEVLRLGGQAGEALLHYGRALTLDPRIMVARTGQIRIALARGDRARARAQLSEALALAPGSPELRRLQAAVGGPGGDAGPDPATDPVPLRP